MEPNKVEFSVRPVTRYIVTRYEEGGDGPCGFAGSSVLGVFDNEITAYEVGYALAKAAHENLGWPPGDERIVYPSRLPKGVPGGIIPVAEGVGG